MRLFTLLLLLVLSAPAAASHEIRHSADYCEGLVAMASHVAFLKQLGSSKDHVLRYIAAVGADYNITARVVAVWQKDAEALYDAADGGVAHVEACYKAAKVANPQRL